MAALAQEAKIERIPADGHPAWKKISQPVLAFLMEGPKTWDDLYRFATREVMSPTLLNNCLAWLDNRGLVKSYYGGESKDLVLWVARLADTFVLPAQKAPEAQVAEVAQDPGEGARREGSQEEPLQEEENGHAEQPKGRQRRKPSKKQPGAHARAPQNRSPKGSAPPPELKR